MLQRFYTLIQEGGMPGDWLVEYAGDRLMLTPAERATLATGSLQINNIIEQPLVLQVEREPPSYDYSEWIEVDDYGNVTRSWSKPGLCEFGEMKL